MKPCRSPRRSTPSNNIGPTQSHSSTRQLPQPHNMDTAWPPWTMMRQSHRTVSHSHFGTAYAATQESMKSQSTTMADMQGQLTNIQQLCMAVGQQPLPNIYAPAQQQHRFNNQHNRRNGGGHGNGGTGGNNGGGGGSFPQQPTWFGGNGAGAQQPTRPPTPYKRWENWNYCHTHGGDVDDTHRSASCRNRGPAHNPNATRANIMGGSIAGMHETIVPSAFGRTPPPPRRPQQQQCSQQHHQCHTTLSRARHNLRTMHARPCPCRRSSPTKE